MHIDVWWNRYKAAKKAAFKAKQGKKKDNESEEDEKKIVVKEEVVKEKATKMDLSALMGGPKKEVDLVKKEDANSEKTQKATTRGASLNNRSN